jgi:hypothetical protein
MKFEGDSVGPWRSTIDVNIVSLVEYSREVFMHERMSCVIQMPQPARRDLLPRFRVRAHYIDCVNEAHNDLTFIPTTFGPYCSGRYDVQSWVYMVMSVF